MTPSDPASLIDSPRAWLRLGLSMLLATISSVGIWAIVVIIPALQEDFGSGRGLTSFVYTAIMTGFALGNGFAGRYVDRYGMMPVAMIAAVLLGAGFVLSAFATSVTQLALLGLVMGLGSAASFGPLLGDISHWFVRRRGFAVAAAASGNYLAGAIWPFSITRLVDSSGWRVTYIAIGVFCFVTMIPIAWLLRYRINAHTDHDAGDTNKSPFGSVTQLQWLLVIAGVACCVAMSMPQVHIVAYSHDLGFGVANGATMLGLMLAGGVISRLGFGFLSDYLGGIRTCLLASFLQCLALAMFLPVDTLGGLYLVSLAFGLSQGGIVPSYAVIVRELMPARDAAARIGIIMMATVGGMAFGGWMTGVIHDWTGSYFIAFLHGIGWNVLNLLIVGGLYLTVRARMLSTT